MEILRLLGYAISFYFAIGVLVALAMHVRGLRHIDHATVGSGVFFHILITPGLIALWPILVIRLVRGGGPGSLESPISARGLRSLHGLSIAAVAIAVPIFAGAGIWNRPAFTPISSIASESSADAIAVAWSQSDQPGVVTASIPEELAASRLIYWSPSNTNDPAARVFLRAIDGYGTFSIRVPQERDHAMGAIWIYAVDAGIWEPVIGLGNEA